MQVAPSRRRPRDVGVQNDPGSPHVGRVRTRRVLRRSRPRDFTPSPEPVDHSTWVPRVWASTRCACPKDVEVHASPLPSWRPATPLPPYPVRRRVIRRRCLGARPDLRRVDGNVAGVPRRIPVLAVAGVAPHNCAGRVGPVPPKRLFVPLPPPYYLRTGLHNSCRRPHFSDRSPPLVR